MSTKTIKAEDVPDALEYRVRWTGTETNPWEATALNERLEPLRWSDGKLVCVAAESPIGALVDCTVMAAEWSNMRGVRRAKPTEKKAG